MLKIKNLVQLELVSADIPGILSHLSRLNVMLQNVHIKDHLTVSFSIHYEDYLTVRKIVSQQGGKLQILSEHGIRRTIYRFTHRPVLIFCIVIVLILSAFLPTRVLFIETTGTKNVSSQYIIAKASECGIRFGASRRKVRSEQMKNRLLSSIPQLHWAGVNTYGCVAVISVEEKNLMDAKEDTVRQISNIVASHDGIITACTVQKGTQLCSVGQAVKEGQMLVSGYTDCGIKLQTTCAQAEITAKTLRYLDAVSPTKYYVRSGTTIEHRKYSLLIGKKIINFSKGSGICGGSCVKMYAKKYLTLPGGRTLPLAVLVEQHMHYPHLTEQIAAEKTDRRLLQMAQTYLRSLMVAGEISYAKTDISHTGDFSRLHGAYSCTESIGRVMFEGRVDSYG